MGKDTSSDDAPVMLLAEEQDEMLQLLERQMQQRFGEILTHTHDVSQKTSDANGMLCGVGITFVQMYRLLTA